MKKYAVLLTMILFGGMLALSSSCGNNAEEEAARLQAIADSLRADSLAQAQALEDSLQQAYDDSVQAVMDSLQAALEAEQGSGKSGGSSYKAPTPKAQPEVKNQTVEVKKGDGMTPKIQPKTEPTSVTNTKSGGGGTTNSGSVTNTKSGGGSGGGGVKSGGAVTKKKGGGQP